MKPNYKSLNRKTSLWILLKKHGEWIIATMAILLIGIVTFLCSSVIAKVCNTSLGVGFCIFLAGICIVALLVLGVLILRMLFTYIRAFYRYTYLPLTEDDAIVLGIDKDPIVYLKTIHDMICYKTLFGEDKAIFDRDTESVLVKLFYHLFFNRTLKDKTSIIAVLNDKEKREALRKALKYDVSYDLFSDLYDFGNVIREIDENDENVIDTIVFTTSIEFMWDDKDVYKANTIILTNNHVYLFGDPLCLRKKMKSDEFDSIETLLNHKMFLNRPEEFSMS